MTMSILGKSCSLMLVGAIATTLSLKHDAKPQNSSTEAGLGTAILSMFGNQPDFMGDVTIVMVGSVTKMKIAKKEGKTRRDLSLLNKATSAADYKISLLAQSEQAWLILDHQQKSYSELPIEYGINAPNPQQIPEMIKQMDKEKVNLKIVDTETIDGHVTNKISMTTKGEKGELLIYIAKDLKNLIVKIETFDQFLETFRDPKEAQPTRTRATLSYELSNISLTMPDGLFQVPQGYKKVDFGSFNAVLEQKTKTSFSPSKPDRSLPKGDPRGVPPPPKPQIVAPATGAVSGSQHSKEGIDRIETPGKDGVGSPKIVYREKAKYTEEARKHKVEGEVTLTAVFRADGTLTDFQVVKGLPYGLSEKAIEAAKKIRFQPATKNGAPVSVRTNLEFRFSLD